MNGNIFNHSLASIPYSFGSCGFGSCNAKAIPPNPPESIINGEPIFAQSHINSYNTAFNQRNRNYQVALNNYYDFSYGDVNSNFVYGTFGSREKYNSHSQSQPFIIHHLQDDASAYNANPYLFVSAGSGGGSGEVNGIRLGSRPLQD